jgi:hypothetical protein
MNRCLTVIALLGVLVLGGCGHKESPVVQSQRYDHYQSVRVDTPGVFGAACTLQSPSGSQVVLSPASVRVARDSRPLRVFCTKGEHFRGAQVIQARKVADENQETAWLYPASVSVPMRLNDSSFQADIKIF